jgi:four helix bundle protein
MNHKELDVWKKSVHFVSQIYEKTASSPDSEKFGLINQIRRASVSIPANIAEGAARNSDKEFIHFLYISLGSAAELETLFTISSDLGYIKQSDFDEIMANLEQIKKMIIGLINYLKKKINHQNP